MCIRHSGCAGVAFGDISTGELFVSEQGGEERSQHVINQLGRFMPSEVLLSPQAASDQVIVDFIKNKLHSVIAVSYTHLSLPTTSAIK